MTRRRILLSVVLLSVLALAPAAQAAEFPDTYTSKFVSDWWDVEASPEFRADIVQKTILPGEETSVSVVLTNRGEVTAFESLDEPTTAVETNESEKEFAYESEATSARSLTSTLEGDEGLTVTGGAAGASSIVGKGRSVTLPFTVRVDTFAKPGVHDLSLEVRYRYLKDAAVEYENGQYEPYFHYVERVEKFDLEVEVEDRAVLRVVDVSLDDGSARAGREAVLRVTYENAGTETANDAEATLRHSSALVNGSRGGSLGTVEPGGTASATYRVKFSDDATAGRLQLRTGVTYEDDEGNTRAAPQVTVPVELAGYRPRFSASSEGTLPVGGDGTVTVTVENLMEETARGAVVTLDPRDPFSSEEPRAYFGDLEPGETGDARFRLKLEDETLAKRYPLRLSVEYLDSSGREHSSRELSVPVAVEAGGGLEGLSTWLLGVVALFVAGGVAAFLYFRR
ncbi:MAG: hypothetical protein MAG715_00334 [Methanonatronarchaeales archaeon]|nr:hypothetical protein [Methanonatronarchaeales archaeon]